MRKSSGFGSSRLNVNMNRRKEEDEVVRRQIFQTSVHKTVNKSSKPHNRMDVNIRSQKVLRKSPEGLEGEAKKKYRSHADRLNMKMLQIQEAAIIPKKPFRRLVRDICENVGPQRLRWQEEALDALQFATQDYMTGLFEDAYHCAQHCKRVTLMAKDLALARRIRGVLDPGNM